MEHTANIDRFAGHPSTARWPPFKTMLQGETAMMLIRKVEKFLREHDMPATKFGRLAAHDPRFVLDLRMGRIPRAATEARTLEWMAQYSEQARSSGADDAAPPAAAPAPAPSYTPAIREAIHA